PSALEVGHRRRGPGVASLDRDHDRVAHASRLQAPGLEVVERAQGAGGLLAALLPPRLARSEEQLLANRTVAGPDVEQVGEMVEAGERIPGRGIEDVPRPDVDARDRASL